jgi:hypothetical protein
MVEILENANTVFQESLDIQSQDIRRFVPPPQNTLEAPAIVRECLLQLKEILVSYDMSLVSDTGETDTNIGKIYSSYLDPMIEVIDQSSQELEPLERAIFKVNSYYLLQSSLAAFTYFEAKGDMLDELITREVMFLVQEQFDEMLKMSGLHQLLEQLKSLPKPLSQHAQTSPTTVEQAMASFDRYLLGLTLDVPETMYRIQSLDIAKRVSQQGSLLFLNAYRTIVLDIEDPANQVMLTNVVPCWSIEKISTRNRNPAVFERGIYLIFSLLMLTPSHSLKPLYIESQDKANSNIMILLHGMGDTAGNFIQFAQRMQLPQTMLCALTGPFRIPFFDNGTSWYSQFGPDGMDLPKSHPLVRKELKESSSLVVDFSNC